VPQRIVNTLAIIGAVSVLTAAGRWTLQRLSPVIVVGRAVTPDQRPIAGAAVFLDRGSSTIERYSVDAAGEFRLPLFPREPHRATWLICAPGMQERIGKPELDHLVTMPLYIYEMVPAQANAHGYYRQLGWKGPIPRECPQAVDSMGWRYPASAGKDPGAYSVTEPDWARYPGPPELPK
jgi:hypothetical protein